MDLVLHDLANDIQPLVTQAEMVSIVDQSSYSEAAAFIKQLVYGIKRVEESIAPHKANAYRTWKELTEHEARILKPAKDAKAILSNKIISWETEQRRIEEENRRLEAEAARKRDEEDRLKAAEAAQAEGASDELVDAILEEEAPLPAVVVRPTFQRATGISRPRENWKGECVSLLDLVKHIAGVKQIAHPELLPLLQANPVAINQTAKAQKTLARIPGIRVYNDPNIAVR
jgi:hypothetical protein